MVRVTGDFIQGSTATGLLVIVYSLSDDSDVQYVNSKYYGQNVVITVAGLTSGQYGVSVFVQENGVPFLRATTLPQTVHMDVLTQQSMQNVMYIMLMQIVASLCILSELSLQKHQKEA